MYEALVRMAALKYVRLGPHDSLAAALETLLERNVLKASLPPEALVDCDVFRRERLYLQDTDEVLRSVLPKLQVSYSVPLREGSGAPVGSG